MGGGDFIARIRRTLQRRGASFEDAEDCVQEGFLRFYGARRSAEVQHPESYVARAAFNASIDQVRRRRISPLSPAQPQGLALVDLTPGPAEVLEARERMERLKLGLDQLSERARRVLLAQRLNGLSYALIARQEGISESAVEKHIARSLAFLSRWMEEA